MKRLKKYKELVIVSWRRLNVNKNTKEEREKEIKAFNEFFDKLILSCYVVFGVFSFISISLFIARVIL